MPVYPVRIRPSYDHVEAHRLEVRPKGSVLECRMLHTDAQTRTEHSQHRQYLAAYAVAYSNLSGHVRTPHW